MKFLKRPLSLVFLLSVCLFELTFAGCAKSKEAIVSEGRVVELHVVERAVEPEPVYVGELEPSEEKLVEETAVEEPRSKEKLSDLQKIEAKPPEITVEELIERLKKTEAIGFLTKLAIRADVLDFKKSVELYRKRGALKETVDTLKSRFNGLMLKIMALLERDPPLSKDIYSARESIWKSLVEAKS